MLDLVVRKVEISQGVRDVCHGAVGHHLELVVAQVQGLQLGVAE